MQEQKKSHRFDPVNSEQDIRGRIIRSGVLSFGIAVLFFIGLLLIYPLVARLPQTGLISKFVDPANWTFVSGITAAITVSLIVGGLIFVFLEHSQNTIQAERQNAEASFNIYKEIYDRLMSAEDLAARRWIIVNIPTLKQMGNDPAAWLGKVKAIIEASPKDPETGRPVGKETIKRVLNTFDFIGFVTSYYWNMENELAEWMSPAVAKVWERLYLYVEDEKKRRNESDYYQAACAFGDYCLRWRQERYPESTIIEDGT